MDERLCAGRATGTLLLLLLLLSGVGGWNYYRNLRLEQQSEEHRPYESYAVADLESLRAAYAAELEEVRADFVSARRRRAGPARDVGSIAGNVEQFQRATRASSAIREAAGDVSARQSQIAALDRELELRARFGQGFARHLKRLTRF